MIALVVAVLASAGIGAGEPARADFASACSSPTRVVDTTQPSFAVGPGETVLIAESYTGGIESLPRTGVVCVAPGVVFSALYMNAASGSLYVAAGGNAVFQNIDLSPLFELWVEGDVQFLTLSAIGNFTVDVTPTGTMEIIGSAAFSSGSFRIDGTMTIGGALALQTGTWVMNTGHVSIDGRADFDGPFFNEGVLEITGALSIGSLGALVNSCTVIASEALTNNSEATSNSGVVRLGGALINSSAGVLRQSATGVIGAAGLADNGLIAGTGQFDFGGFTSVAGAFTGDSPTSPIVVDSQAPPGNVFDSVTGTVSNTIRGTVEVPPAAPACGLTEPAPAADVETTITGPATALQGSSVQYEVRLINHGPDDAEAVAAQVTLPAGFTLTGSTPAGTVASGLISWDAGDIAAGSEVVLAFVGTADAAPGTVLPFTVSSTSPTFDAVGGNNAGTAVNATVRTTVEAVPPPPNNSPDLADLQLDTTTGALATGQLSATDADPGQVLTYTSAPAAHGTLTLTADGAFSYRSAADFTGIESIPVQACDNAAPTPGCDTATLTIRVFPIAGDDAGQTAQGTPISGSITANDSPGAQLAAAPVVAPGNGVVTLDPTTGTATYTPASGFVGTDSFVYEMCSPTAPELCDTATVTITVVVLNHPPVVEILTMTTTANTPVQAPVPATDPDAGDALRMETGIPPRSGSASVVPPDQTRYAPTANFTGRDQYAVVVCDDGTPVLCTARRVIVEVSPVALPDDATTSQGATVGVDIGGNDVGERDAPVIVAAPANGSATVSGSGLVYSPSPSFVGTDVLTYQVCSLSASDLCATATVTITVLPAPVGEPGPGNGSGGGGGGSSGSDSIELGATGVDVVPGVLAGMLLVATGLVFLRRRARPHT